MTILVYTSAVFNTKNTMRATYAIDLKRFAVRLTKSC